MQCSCLMFSLARQAIPAKSAPTMKTAWDRSSPRRGMRRARMGYLFAVADGVGGMDLGEVASATAISGGDRGVCERAGREHAARPVAAPGAARQRRRARPHAWSASTAARRWPQPWWPARCATTRPLSPTWATRAATWSATGKARQITEDHTLVNQQRKLGLISAEDVAESESRHVLIKSLGPELFVSPDTTSRYAAVRRRAGAVHRRRCTTSCRESEMAEIVSQTSKDMDEIAHELVARAIEDGRKRQHDRAGYPGALSGAGRNVPRTALPAAGA